jgi:hypothetical protein
MAGKITSASYDLLHQEKAREEEQKRITRAHLGLAPSTSTSLDHNMNKIVKKFGASTASIPNLATNSHASCTLLPTLVTTSQTIGSNISQDCTNMISCSSNNLVKSGLPSYSMADKLTWGPAVLKVHRNFLLLCIPTESTKLC